MWLHYLSMAFNNLRRQARYSALNLLGLALGLTGCVLMLLYVLDELSFDTHWPQAEQLHRLELRFDQMQNSRLASVAGNMGPELERLGLVAEYGRMMRVDMPLLLEQREYRFSRQFYLEPELLDLLPLQGVAGDLKQALSADGHLVLTQSVARQLFGEEQALGKKLSNAKGDWFVVSAIVADPEPHSHWQYEMLLPMAHVVAEQGQQRLNNWFRNDFYTYVRQAPGMDLHSLEPQVAAALLPPLRKLVPDLQVSFFLQPVMAIHLDSQAIGELEVNGSRSQIWLFLTVAFLVLFIALFNYINFAIVIGARRVREIGIRQLAGADRRQLVQQFLTESVLAVGLAIAAALVLSTVLLPWLNLILQKQLALSLFLSGYYPLLLFVLALGAALAAGLYPALLLSRLDTLDALRGYGFKGSSGLWFRRLMLGLQMLIAMTLFSWGGHIYLQMQQVQQIDLGYQRHDRLVIPGLDSAWLQQNYQVLKQQFEQSGLALKLSASEHVPTYPVTNFVQLRRSNDVTKALENISQIDVLPNYFATLEIRLLAGEDFRQTTAAQQVQMQVVINELAAQQLGFSSAAEAVGQYVDLGYDPEYRQKVSAVISAVAANYYLHSVQQSVQPLVITSAGFSLQKANLVVQLPPDGLQNWQQQAPVLWQQLTGMQLPEYPLLDERFMQLHLKLYLQGQLIAIFTLLALLIVCFGLLGLSSYNSQLRKKELTVRQLLGASFSELGWLLSRDYIGIAAVAGLLSTVAAVWLIQSWLQQFAEHVGLNPWILFASPLLVCLLTALIIMLVLWSVRSWSVAAVLKSE
jgi:putative ABC transport system permease protein